MKFIIAILFFSTGAFAASTRSIDADSITSPDKTKTYSLPSATDTLVGRSSSDTLINKTLSGASNTFVQVPVAINSLQEIPSGTINGTNTAFTLAFTPVASISVRLFLDGLLLNQGAGLDYTISGATITMITAPALGQVLRAVYPKY